MIRNIILLTFVMCYSPLCFAQTPHNLLWDGTPEDGKKALKIMMDDPTWVTKRDSDQRTPLHVAARFNHTSVVKWLLENGADVDAQAYNRFTPLHLTKNPEIVKLILAKKPNLKLKSVSGTVLQDSIDALRHYAGISNPDSNIKRKTDSLRKIVDMYLEHIGDDIDLISAVRLGRLNTVRIIVNENPEAILGKKHGPSPLREAADWGQLEICKFLVQAHKVDVNDFEGGSGYPVIISALKHPDIVRYLIKYGVDLNKRITWNGGRTGRWIIGDDATALHFAARDGVPETIKILLDAGVDPFATAHDSFDKKRKQTALEVAAFFGKTDNAIAILEHPKFQAGDAKLRQQVLYKSLVIGSQVSWLASESQDRTELLDALLTDRAKLKATDSIQSLLQTTVCGIRPHNAQENESIKKMVSVLKKHGAKLDVYSAVAIGDFDALAKLLKTTPTAANTLSIDGYPAMHMAIKMNYSQAVKLLLDAGGDVEIKNKSKSTGSEGETPLICVIVWAHDKIAEMLIEAGANVNAKAENQATPLHEAVGLGNVSIAKILLKNGAHKHAKDNEGRTPLEWADRSSAKEFEKLFSEFEDSETKE